MWRPVRTTNAAPITSKKNQRPYLSERIHENMKIREHESIYSRVLVQYINAPSTKVTNLISCPHMLDFDGKFSLPENLKIINHCPLCSCSTTKLEARLLGETADRQTVYLHCAECGGSIIAHFMVSGAGITSYGLVTDLSFDDLVKFKKHDPLELDDVIRVHESLKSSHFLGKIRRP
jgi:hypothetical protein